MNTTDYFIDYNFYYDYLNETEEDLYRYYGTIEFVFHYVKSWKRLMDGYLYFLLGTITLISNMALIYGMIDRKCVTSTAILLLSLAFSISVSTLAQLPNSVYLILYGDATVLTLPADTWCRVLHVCDAIKNIAVSFGNWTTVCLAIQRCVVVFYPFKAAILFTVRRTSLVQTVILVLCCLLHVYTWIILDILHAEIWIDDGQSHSCYINVRNIPESNTPLNTVFTDEMTRHAIQYVVPCMILTVATLLLVHRLRKAKQSTPGDSTARSRGGSYTMRNSRMTKATKFVLSILLLFLLNQILHTIVFILYMQDYLAIEETLSNKSDSIISTVLRYAAILTYQCIFFIFVLMSERYRRNIKSHFSKISVKSRSEPSTSISKY